MKLPSVRPDLLAVFLIYFVLGFLLYAAAYAAVAAMCNSQQEAQQANIPVTMCILAGFMAMFSLLNEPSGSLARTLSLIPLMAPFVVPVRYSLAPIPIGELLLSMGLTFGGNAAGGVGGGADLSGGHPDVWEAAEAFGGVEVGEELRREDVTA